MGCSPSTPRSSARRAAPVSTPRWWGWPPPLTGRATGWWVPTAGLHPGDAGFFGSEGATHLDAPVVGMAATPDGKGYWLVAADGGIFTHGDAGFFGSEGATDLNAPIVGMAATPDGKGYWLVAADGGVFTHGDAGFFGSEGGHPTSTPPWWAWQPPRTERATGWWLPTAGSSPTATPGSSAPKAPSTSTPRWWAWQPPPTERATGWWRSDGGVFTHGDAPFFGSLGSTRLNAPVRTIVAGA